MRKGYIEKAKEYKELGLNPVPTTKEKVPIRKNFSSIISYEEIENYKWDGIGIATGFSSGGLEVLDFDLKNSDKPREFLSKFKKTVNDKELLKKLVVQKTPSNGYHFIYRSDTYSTNKKLAVNKDGKAIIETRGEGGFIKCSPSEGYELIQNDFSKIPILNEEERLKLIVSSRILSEKFIEHASKRYRYEDKQYLEKFKDYDNDVSIGVSLLEEYGWAVLEENDEWVHFTRPNKRTGVSASYNKEGKFLFVFSTSQDCFETERPYNNHAILAELKFNGDYRKAYKWLYDNGYGNDEYDNIKTRNEVEDEEWDETLQTLSFLSNESEENEYLEQARKGEIEQGLSTGWSALDEYFRLKPNSLNVGLGFDGVGKSVFMLSLAAASNTLHDWKWGMIMPENRTAMSRRRLIEAMSGRTIQELKDDNMFYDYLLKAKDGFKIVANRKHYSIDDVIEMSKRMYEYYGVSAILIDPYNFFKTDGNGYSTDTRILSELRVFSEKYCSVYLMAHPNSDAARNRKDQYGYLKAPTKYDIQGGVNFAYRVDDFFTLHRIRNHEDSTIRRTMQFTVEKIKEEETGGKVHISGEYTDLIWERRDGFLGYWDVNGDNPLYKAYKNKMNIKDAIEPVSPDVAFTDFNFNENDIEDIPF